MDLKRVVVTGLGALTPLGKSVAEYWQALEDGVSGCDDIKQFDCSKFKTRFACEVKDFDPTTYLDRKEARKMDRYCQFALIASDEAVKDAGITKENVDADRVGVIFASGIGGLITFQEEVINFASGDGTPRFNPFFIPKMILDIAAGQISMRHGFRGPNYAVVSACASSTNAIIDSFDVIRLGKADIVLTGGSEAVISASGMGGFNAMKALSERNDDPKTASRPFDKDRDGFVMGEGSGVMVFETLEHALSRGAENIYGIVAGFGLTDDAFHITQPAPGGEGAVRSMQLSIKDAGLMPNDIDYINAHGTSTYHNDKNESAAIIQVFGEHAFNLAVSSTKSMTGHLLGAAGAIEAIATLMAIKHSMVPPTINYEVPDPECTLNYTPNTPVKKVIKAAISNTFGFGGHNASICFKAYEE